LFRTYGAAMGVVYPLCRPPGYCIDGAKGIVDHGLPEIVAKTKAS
jgi:hypothetical protein